MRLVGFYFALFLMLTSAWLLGEGLHRLRQPALVGQLLAGVVIGPSLLNLVQPTADLAAVEGVALFFIMLLTGLTVDPSKLVAAGKRGALVSCISFAIPFLAAVAVSEWFGIGAASSLTIGLTVSITAVPVNTMILMELGLFDTDLGATVIAAGVIDDIISFVALSLILLLAGGSASSDWSVATEVVTIAIFLVAVLACEHFVRHNLERVKRWTDDLERGLGAPGSYFALLVAAAVGVSLLAAWAGLQLVIGAFFAGLVLSELAGPTRLGEASSVVRGATYGFFGPIAFAYIGTEFIFGSVAAVPFLVLSLLAVALASKFLGGYVGARISRFSSNQSLIIGSLMNSRGFVELVIATTAYQLGLIDQGIFSVVVGVGILTTIISPITTRRFMQRTPESGEPQGATNRSQTL